MTDPGHTSADGRSRRRRAATRFYGAEQPVPHDRWLVSWADFMTLLFAFFVVMFAASHHSQDVLGRLAGAIHSGFNGTRVAPLRPPPRASLPTDPDFDLLQRQLRAVLGPSVEKHEVSLVETGEGLVISFEELGFFASGQAAMLPGQASKIVKAGQILAAHDLTVRVEGHSDDQPIHNAVFRSNWELSTARAMTVLLLLVDQAHYNPTHLSLAGYGPYHPIADNSSAAGRQKNRRVDLVVLRHPGV